MEFRRVLFRSRRESEADAIWGQRAAARRSFTQGQRDCEAQTRAVRDQALKPKAWLDAKGAVADAQQMLEVVQRRRDEVLAAVSRLERIRRIAPAVRLRSDHFAALELGRANVCNPVTNAPLVCRVLLEKTIVTRK